MTSSNIPLRADGADLAGGKRTSRATHTQRAQKGMIVERIAKNRGKKPPRRRAGRKGEIGKGTGGRIPDPGAAICAESHKDPQFVRNGSRNDLRGVIKGTAAAVLRR
jgi:hypothetical protein